MSYDPWKDHILEPLEIGEKVQAYYLRDPKLGRMQSTLIVFSPEGIALMGDLVPHGNGTVSCYDYGAEWFSRPLGAGYLCEKFLRKEFVPEAAVRGLQWEILDRRREGYFTKKEARDLWSRAECIPDDFTGPQTVYEFWTGDLNNDAEGCPGWGYNPEAVSALVGIQRKFAELYPALRRRIEVTT